MELVPARWEYWTAVAMLAVIGLTVGGGPRGFRRLASRRGYWVSLAAFVVFCTAMDLAAIGLGWWRWPAAHIAGGRLWSIPLEEFGVMVIAHLFIVSLWESGKV